MNRRRTAISIVLLAWVVSAAWLLRYEAFPAYFTGTFSGYEEMLSSDIMMSDSWMKITFNGKPIGYSHSSIEVNDTDPLFHYKVMNEMDLKIRLMQEDQDIEIDSVSMLDAMHQLQKFTFTLTSKPSDTAFDRQNLMMITAIRRYEQVFSVSIITPHSSRRMRVEIPKDVVIYSPMTDMAMRELSPGQSMTVKTLEPTTLTTTFITIKALNHEEITVNKIKRKATKLASEYHGNKVHSWIDSDGEVLRQETPFGWIMERCTPEEALATVLGDTSEDILRSMAVPCQGNIADPRKSIKLKLLLTGVPLSRAELETPRQSVESIDEEGAVLITRKSSFSREETTSLPDAAKYPEALKSSAFIQSDHPDIISRARIITKNRKSDFDKAEAIYTWVHKNVDKQMTVSLPSALDVLKTMKGDCNEHTYLFVALARAAGLPAKVKVGLAYHQNAFYYHAWPTVHINGQWVEMDPTWGELFVDAAHISFTEGELADQVGIIKLMGQLRIKVIENIDSASEEKE